MKRFVVTTNNENRLETASKRFMLAEYVVALMNPLFFQRSPQVLPYAQETGGSHRFVVDAKNEWCLSFHEDDAKVFWLEHSENNMVALEALTTWIVYRFCEGSKIEVINI